QGRVGERLAGGRCGRPGVLRKAGFRPTLPGKVLDGIRGRGEDSVMTLPHRIPDPPREPPALHTRASEDLRFIRSTMQRAAAFTAVPGWGGVLMGTIAVFASIAAATTESRLGWVLTWICAAVLAFLVGATDMANKLRAGGNSLFRGPASRFASALAPPIVAGACL